jgi:hypothetical protein
MLLIKSSNGNPKVSIEGNENIDFNQLSGETSHGEMKTREIT